MSKTIVILLGFFAFCLLGVILLVGIGASYHNKEVQLRNAITAKYEALKLEHDTLKKTLIQTAGVTEEGADLIVKAISANAAGRSGGDVLKFVKEAVPTVDLSLHKNLQNTIVSMRDQWKQRWRDILDLNREHDNLIDQFPSNIFMMILHRDKIVIKLVTSSDTEKAFDTGKDDDTQLFHRK